MIVYDKNVSDFVFSRHVSTFIQNVIYNEKNVNLFENININWLEKDLQNKLSRCIIETVKTFRFSENRIELLIESIDMKINSMEAITEGERKKLKSNIVEPLKRFKDHVFFDKFIPKILYTSNRLYFIPLFNLKVDYIVDIFLLLANNSDIIDKFYYVDINGAEVRVVYPELYTGIKDIYDVICEKFNIQRPKSIVKRTILSYIHGAKINNSDFNEIINNIKISQEEPGIYIEVQKLFIQNLLNMIGEYDRLIFINYDGALISRIKK